MERPSVSVETILLKRSISNELSDHTVKALVCDGREMVIAIDPNTGKAKTWQVDVINPLTGEISISIIESDVRVFSSKHS